MKNQKVMIQSNWAEVSWKLVDNIKEDLRPFETPQRSVKIKI